MIEQIDYKFSTQNTIEVGRIRSPEKKLNKLADLLGKDFTPGLNLFESKFCLI